MKKKNVVSSFLREHVMYLVLIGLVIFFSVTTKSFMTWTNVRNVINQSAYLLIIGVGMCFIMLSGCMDLSIGYQLSLLGVLMGTMLEKGVAWPLVIVITLCTGVVLSGLNGFLYVRLNVFPFLITLATQYIFWGLSYIISESRTFSGFPDAFKFIGQGYIGPIPFPIILMVICMTFGIILLNRTYFGRFTYGLGGNPAAVALAGVNVKKMKFMIFVMAGFFIALGCIVLVSRTGSSASTMGPGLEFTVLAGGFLGGIKPGGGGGKMSNIIVGLLILQVLSNGMQMMQLGTYPQYVAKGVVLIFALALDAYQASRLERQAKLVIGSELDAEDTAPAQ